MNNASFKEKRKIIEVRGLTYCYTDGTKALDNINIDFYNGEFIAFIGQNGCGKNNLFQVPERDLQAYRRENTDQRP